MSQKQYTAGELADAIALAENRAALKANHDRMADHRRSVLGDKDFEENARIDAWCKVGRVTGDANKPPSTWTVPKGWPAPYTDFNSWLNINLDGWAKLGAQSAGLIESDQEKYLRAFKEATSK